MNIAFVINQTHKELVSFTTTYLAFECYRRGYTVYYIGVGDFVYLEDGSIAAHARSVAPGVAEDGAALLSKMRDAEKQLLLASQLDVLWLRNDPVEDMENRVWAQDIAIHFAHFAKSENVLVINCPVGLAFASNKLYLQYFPESVRPNTLITRKLSDVERFFKENKRKIILKPLKGSGGKNVFLIDSSSVKNMKQIVEAICRDGYLVAQSYLRKAKHGDIRLFLVDGKPLVVDGKYAAIHRVQSKGEIRSNIHQGAKPQIARITPKILKLVALVAEKLVQEGMYFVGLDIVDDKIMEINVFSPGGLIQASHLNQVNFGAALIDQVQTKLIETRASAQSGAVVLTAV